MSRKIASNTREFGLATGTGERGLPTNAYVFLDRVVKFANAEDTPWVPILAKIIAHEVGHLLLGDSHSRSGIMRAHWRSGEIRQALMGDLLFPPREAEMMRDEVRRRIALCLDAACLPNRCGLLRESHPRKTVNIGVAAHIAAAAPGGPRYDDKMTPEERCGIENAVWLCQNCAKLIDNDPPRYTTDLLRRCRRLSEEAAMLGVESMPTVASTASDADLIRFLRVVL